MQFGKTGTPDSETDSTTNYITWGKGFLLFDLVLHLEIEIGMASWLPPRVVVRIKIHTVYNTANNLNSIFY